MAVAPAFLRSLIARVGRAIAKGALIKAGEEVTGRTVPTVLDAVRRVADDLGLDLDDREEAKVAVEEAVNRGEIAQNQLESVEEVIMTDFNDFMSIGLNRCGSDQETFSGLVEVWNREKDEIKAMTQAEVRRNLTCP